MIVTIEIHLDGYQSWEEERKAVEEFIEEELDFSASSIRIIDIIVPEEDKY